MGLRLFAGERVGQSQSIERRTVTLLVLIFSWDLLIIIKKPKKKNTEHHQLDKHFVYALIFFIPVLF